MYQDPNHCTANASNTNQNMNTSHLPELEVSGEFDHGMLDPIIMEGRDCNGKKKDELSMEQVKDAFWTAERAVDKATKSVCGRVGHLMEGIVHRRGSATADSKKKEEDLKDNHKEDYRGEKILFYGLERS